MVNHLMLWAADNPRLERTITNNKLFGKLVHRFIAGDELADALANAGADSPAGAGRNSVGRFEAANSTAANARAVPPVSSSAYCPLS